MEFLPNSGRILWCRDCGGGFQPCSLAIQNRAKAVAKVLEEMGCSLLYVGRLSMKRQTEEERSNEGQEERKESLRRAGSESGRNSI